ncbi:hypothetical protein ACFQHO_08735 [Actinomadura yumaensis]|uniref:hypothetical protein n=1 Tax=Actinomadura yumaensis TaxID=111807 RepID=UPI0036177620
MKSIIAGRRARSRAAGRVAAATAAATAAAGAALLAPGPAAHAAPVPPGTPEDVSVPPGAAHVLPAGTGNVAARGKPGPRGRTAPAPRVEFRYSAPEVADAGTPSPGSGRSATAARTRWTRSSSTTA